MMSLYISVPTLGNTVIVDASGIGDYTTIQAAIDDANNGDIVQVTPGAYAENINFLGKSITVTGTNPENPGIVAGTIIDANGHSSVVTFDHHETNDAVLTGFTITGGIGTFVLTAADTNMYWGAGICCDDSSPTIIRNVITDNHGPAIMDGNNPIEATYGGGIVSMGGNPIITRNTIKGNSAYLGAAVAVVSGDAVISNNVIYANSAVYGGAVVQMFGGKLLSNTIVTNRGSFGGGACMLYDEIIGSGFSKDNIISDNTQGGGLYADFNSLFTTTYEWIGPPNPYEGEVIIIHSLDYFLSNNVFNNSPNDYFDTNDLVGLAGNISIDPCFARPGYWNMNDTPADTNDDFWMDGDYHLKSEAGRWQQSIYACLDPTADRFIDLSDFAAFAAFWRQKGGSVPADMDNSGLIDLSDLALLLDSYLTGYNLGVWVHDQLTSPCIDAGDPNSLWTAELWPHGKRINMGAFGNTPQASMSLSTAGNIANLDNDPFDNLDFLDLDRLTHKWLRQHVLLAEDLNRDGVVNLPDYAILAEQWIITSPGP